MNWLGFIAFSLTAIGYIFKKYFEHSLERQIKNKEYYRSLLLCMRSFHAITKGKEDTTNQEPEKEHQHIMEERKKFIEIYQAGWTFLPADVLRAMNVFLDSLNPLIKPTSPDAKEIAYQKLAYKIREQFFTKECFLYRIFFSLEKDDSTLSYDEFRIVSTKP